MNLEIIIVAIIAASLPGILLLIQNRGKNRAEMRLSEAQTMAAEAEKDNINADTQNKIIKALQDDTAALRKELEELRSRLSIAESRAATSEARAATAESRVLDYERLFATARGDIVRLGEEVAKERKDNQCKINKIALLVVRLIEQVKHLGGTPAITDVESGILDKLVKIGA